MAVVLRLFTPLVKRRSISGLRWLGDVFASNPNILEEYTDTASVQDFRQRIQDEIGKSADDDGHKSIVGIADVLAIYPEELPQQADASSDGETAEEERAEE